MGSHGKRAGMHSPFEYSFGGPVGTLGIMLTMPLFVVVMILIPTCQNDDLSWSQHVSPKRFFNGSVFVLYLGWFLVHALLYITPFGKVTEGLPLVNGSRLSYRCNAFTVFLMTTALVAVGYFVLGLPLPWIYKNILPLSVASLTFSAGLSLYLYLRSFQAPPAKLAKHGTSGNPVYDFFMGRELNPRICQFDWKFFCELRPGLIGWVVLELSMLAWNFEKERSVSVPLAVITGYHAWYVADALLNEPAVLSTKDIIEEGFGFMLVCGDLSWVPFFYSTQAQYIVAKTPSVPAGLVLLSLIFHVVGYIIFRQSNLQKNRFRNNPSDKRLQGIKTIPTSIPEKQLLCDGWWSFVRHPNYLGDLLMTLSWTIICGFDSIYPLVYCVYMFVLLIHREIRDEEVCHQKYGPAWEKYRSTNYWLQLQSRTINRMEDSGGSIQENIPASSQRTSYVKIFLEKLHSRTLWTSFFLGQVCSCLLCGTAVTSTYLMQKNVNCPTAQSFLNYVLIGAIYSTLFGLQSKAKEGLWQALRRRWWKYILLAIVDVEANYLFVKAYHFTTLTSVQLLDCSTIPFVLILSCVVLGYRFTCLHYFGVLLCVCGAAAMVVGDMFTKKDEAEGRNRLIGNFMVIGGSLLYAMSNVTEEFVVKNHSRLEFLSMLGLFGSAVSGVQLVVLERGELCLVDWSDWEIIAYLLLFALFLFGLYSLVPLLMRKSGATVFNLSILSADFYALIVGLTLFGYKFHLLYFVGFVLVITGLVTYCIRPPRSKLESEPSLRPDPGNENISSNVVLTGYSSTFCDEQV